MHAKRQYTTFNETLKRMRRISVYFDYISIVPQPQYGFGSVHENIIMVAVIEHCSEQRLHPLPYDALA